MAPPPAPVADERRRAAARLLERLLLLLLLPALVRFAAARRPLPPAPAPAPLCVDVARDPAERLRLLPGVGPERARALLADRARNGAPERLEDLLRVPGIGPLTLEAWRRARQVRVLCGPPSPGTHAR